MKDVISYSPIIISLVAIGISIFVANKQNKIALFEKRYELYFEVNNFSLLGKDMFEQYMFLKDNITVPEAEDAFNEFTYVDYALYNFLENTNLIKPKVNVRFARVYIDKLYRASIANYFKSHLRLVKKVAWLFDEKSSIAFEKNLNKVILIFDDKVMEGSEFNFEDQIRDLSKESDELIQNSLRSMEKKIKI